MEDNNEARLQTFSSLATLVFKSFSIPESQRSRLRNQAGTKLCRFVSPNLAQQSGMLNLWHA